MFCYPIPGTAPIEGGPGAPSGADRHVLYVDTTGAPSACTLYELYNAQNFAGNQWTAQNGAIFHLGSNALRNDRVDQRRRGGPPHLARSRPRRRSARGIDPARHAFHDEPHRAGVHPSGHARGRRDGREPASHGLRVRLRADYAVASAPAPAQTILRAMQTYGLILADNGSDWYITGDSDDRWGRDHGRRDHGPRGRARKRLPGPRHGTLDAAVARQPPGYFSPAT
jgi:hypothetical protein